MRTSLRHTFLSLCVILAATTATATPTTTTAATTTASWGSEVPQKDTHIPQKHTHIFAVEACDTLRLDHYVAEVEGERPCVVFLFGGGFSAGARSEQEDIPYFEHLLGRGFDVVAIDYRLGMKDFAESGFMAFVGALQNSINIAVEDLFRATNFILDHADEWQIDRENIVVSGSSAGAIAVLQGEYIVCNSLLMSELLPEGFNYAGVISFAGAVYSLSGAPDWTSDAAPMLLFHGTADRQVPYNKMAMLGRGMYGSKYIVRRLEAADAPYWFYTVEYETHSMATKPMHENHAEIDIFLEEFVLKRRHLQRTTLVVDEAVPECRTLFLPTDYIDSNY